MDRLEEQRMAMAGKLRQALAPNPMSVSLHADWVRIIADLLEGKESAEIHLSKH